MNSVFKSEQLQKSFSLEPTDSASSQFENERILHQQGGSPKLVNRSHRQLNRISQLLNLGLEKLKVLTSNQSPIGEFQFLNCLLNWNFIIIELYWLEHNQKGEQLGGLAMIRNKNLRIYKNLLGRIYKRGRLLHMNSKANRSKDRFRLQFQFFSLSFLVRRSSSDELNR